MKKRTAEEVLEYMIVVLLSYLEALQGYTDADEEQFQYGERVAYTECLECVQTWEKAWEHGLDFEIEERFPL